MHPRIRFLIFAVPLAAATVVAAGAAYVLTRGLDVTIKNSGQQTMRNVELLITGSEISLGDIQPGQSAVGRLHPSDDSDVKVNFTDASGRGQSLQGCDYVTGGMDGTIDIEIADGQLKIFKDVVVRPVRRVHNQPLQWTGPGVVICTGQSACSRRPGH